MSNGWGPAVVDSQQEYDFIKEGQKGFLNSISYSIGGSTDMQIDDIFNYTYYISNDTGKIYPIWHKTDLFDSTSYVQHVQQKRYLLFYQNENINNCFSKL